MMISIRGTYENGTIKLLDPIDIKNDANVVITFLDDSFPISGGEPSETDISLEQENDVEAMIEKDEKPEEFYEGLRKHKRYKAKGNITIVDEEETTYPLNDYSAGGLSFLANKVFPIGENITAALKYNASGEVLVMDFEIIVRRVFEEEQERFKIGCQFLDNVDEELWHTIMGQ